MLGNRYLSFARLAPLLPIVVVWLGCAGTGPPLRQVDFDGFVEEVQRKTGVVKQFKAIFVKTRRAEVFDREMTVRGALIFQKPGKFRLTMTGDVSVEILSDGTFVSVEHDKKDREVFHVRGERDLSRFEDPLMVLINGIGNGDLRRFTVLKAGYEGGSYVADLEPGNGHSLVRIRKVVLEFASTGELNSVRILFKNGDEDKTTFESWTLLSHDDPELIQLNRQLERMSEPAATEASDIALHPMG